MPAPNPEFSPSLLQARSGLPTESLDITASTGGRSSANLATRWASNQKKIGEKNRASLLLGICGGEGRGVGEGRAVAARAGEKPRRGKLCVREYVRVALWRWYNSNTIARAATTEGEKTVCFVNISGRVDIQQVFWFATNPYRQVDGTTASSRCIGLKTAWLEPV